MEQEDKRRAILEGLFTIALAFVASYALAYGLKFALNTEYPLGAIPTGSMIPTYNIGDLIIIRGESNTSRISIGDVIVFHNPVPGLYDELIIHRVNATFFKGQLYFITKGDNNQGIDLYPVPANYVVGKVISGIPLLGHLFLGVNELFDKIGIPPDLRTSALTIVLAIIVIVLPSPPDEKNAKNSK